MADRLKTLMQNLPDGIDAAIITSGCNRLYYLGFNSSAGVIFVTRKKAYFLIDFRYIEQARRRVKNCEVILLEKLSSQLNSLCLENAVHKAAVENSYITIKEANAVKDYIAPAVLDFSPELDEVILNQRAVKDDEEIVLLKKAQALTDKTFEYILPKIKAGKTEKEIALDMEFFMRREGSEGVSFDFIVVGGKNSALPHGVPTDYVLQNGDFVTMDFGAVCGGYHADMTRTAAIDHVSDEQLRVYNTVLSAHKAAVKAAKSGAAGCEVDKAARDLIDEAGYRGCFGHGLGHSVGVEIHESPRFSAGEKRRIPSGTVITIEPGIYLENRFGVRIEDTGVITENGFESFAKSPKELIILK